MPLGWPYTLHEPDIRVTLRFLTTEEGGRRGPVKSGYRGQFFYDNHHWDAPHTYPTEWVELGVETTAELHFLSPRFHAGKLFPGQPFGIYEGSKKVAEGKITEILALEKNAAEDRLDHDDGL